MNKRSKLLKRLIIAILLLACVAAFVAHKFVQNYGFDGLGDFIAVYRHNKNLASKVEPLEMKIILSDDDYDFLKKRRDKAIERGIQINDGEDNYVPCKIIQNGDTVKAELRLKGHMTDHLEGDKWSFRVKTDKKPVLGMRRFSLQEPGTRNYAYEWVYHQLLKKEGIIHLNYDFIHLQLNDKDLGIYAIEEHFGQHVLEHNNRPAGAILRWNPNLYWEWRIDELQGTFLNEQYSNYSSSFVEPYEKGTVEDDSVLLNTYMRGASLLEAFRRGEMITSEVFDVILMARFHAIIDLVGGHHSLDWSDVKFFYNSKTNKIEPVGYESFSVRKTESISGQRIPDVYEPPGFNYHDRLFADPVFFAAYIKELERIADEKYFNNFIAGIQDELDKKNGIIAREYPYKKFTFLPYFENIDLIRQNLQLPKPFHAFLETKNDSSIAIQLSPVSDFPIEILALVVNGKHEIPIANPFTLPAKARNTYAHYFVVSFKHADLKLKNLVLKARIPGSSWIFETEVSDLPAHKKIDPGNQLDDKSELTSKNQHPALINYHDSIWFFNSQEISIDQSLVFTDSQDVLVFFPGQTVNFEEHGSIFSFGRIEFRGSSEEDGNIEVTASQTTGSTGINSMPKIILQAGDLTCSNVSFYETENFLSATDAEIYFTQCRFGDIHHEFMSAKLSVIHFDQCGGGTVASLGYFEQSMLRLRDSFFKNGNQFIEANGSDIDLIACDISNFSVCAVLSYSSSLRSWNSNFSGKDYIGVLNHASEMNLHGGIVSTATTGFLLDEKNNLPGESTYLLYRCEVNNISSLEKRP